MERALAATRKRHAHRLAASSNSSGTEFRNKAGRGYLRLPQPQGLSRAQRRALSSQSNNRSCHPGDSHKDRSGLPLRVERTPERSRLRVSPRVFHAVRGNRQWAGVQERSRIATRQNKEWPNTGSCAWSRCYFPAIDFVAAINASTLLLSTIADPVSTKAGTCAKLSWAQSAPRFFSPEWCRSSSILSPINAMV